MRTVLTNTVSITEEQIYNEFLRLGMKQLIAHDLSKRYYHNNLTYRDLENLEKQFGIKFENLEFKIDTVKNELNTKIDNVEKNLQKDIANLDAKIDIVEKNLKQNLDEKLKIHEKFLLEKLNISNRLIIIITIIIAPIAISSIANIITALINGFSK
ncbi:Bdr family repetitive protein (plasmid) [Borreliella yangtzensis]|uniref:Bdr family repetitive protein n=1 Tax=Borreliella yangtzensis TaxID=683292 RepID=UPI003BA0D8F4